MTSAAMERLRAEFPLAGRTYSLYHIVEDCIVPEEYMRIVLPSVTHPGDMPLLALIVPEMHAASIPAEFLRDSWRELFRHDDFRSDRIIQLYRAGVPVAYAAQLIEYGEDASLAITAWNAGLAPEYAREALG